MTAVSHALTVIGYHEMPEKERPPRRIWLDPEALEAHFEWIEEQRKAGPGSELVPDMTQNELTKGLRRG